MNKEEVSIELEPEYIASELERYTEQLRCLTPSQEEYEEVIEEADKLSKRAADIIAGKEELHNTNYHSGTRTIDMGEGKWISMDTGNLEKDVRRLLDTGKETDYTELYNVLKEYSQARKIQDNEENYIAETRT